MTWSKIIEIGAASLALYFSIESDWFEMRMNRIFYVHAYE